jgi:excisionase family DNA binding protein
MSEHTRRREHVPQRPSSGLLHGVSDAEIGTDATGTRHEHSSRRTERFERLAISASEAAEALGCSVSTVYRMIRAGELRSARSSANGRIFVNLQSARDFVDGHTRSLEQRDEERRKRLA